VTLGSSFSSSPTQYPPTPTPIFSLGRHGFSSENIDFSDHFDEADLPVKKTEKQHVRIVESTIQNETEEMFVPPRYFKLGKESLSVALGSSQPLQIHKENQKIGFHNFEIQTEKLAQQWCSFLFRMRFNCKGGLLLMVIFL